MTTGCDFYQLYTPDLLCFDLTFKITLLLWCETSSAWEGTLVRTNSNRAERDLFKLEPQLTETKKAGSTTD